MTGRAAKRRKADGVEQILSGQNAEFAARVSKAILRFAPGVAFTSDDLRKRVRGEGHPNTWGASLHNACRAGLLVHEGFRRSKRPESHARVVAIWRRV